MTGALGKLDESAARTCFGALAVGATEMEPGCAATWFAFCPDGGAETMTAGCATSGIATGALPRDEYAVEADDCFEAEGPFAVEAEGCADAEGFATEAAA